MIAIDAYFIRPQFWLVMNYLSEMSEEQTLVMTSGHPQGLFPSHSNAPRVVVTNGMVRVHNEIKIKIKYSFICMCGGLSCRTNGPVKPYYQYIR